MQWYYQKGPLAAKEINKSNVLKAVSFIFIVTPAVIVAKLIMFISK
ncbi:hypothetical protein [Xenorhabdus sp. Sc-CR9]|nr:hypothetical protein [Xenorhabdus sp. Sc-CR9]